MDEIARRLLKAEQDFEYGWDNFFANIGRDDALDWVRVHAIAWLIPFPMSKSIFNILHSIERLSCDEVESEVKRELVEKERLGNMKLHILSSKHVLYSEIKRNIVSVLLAPIQPIDILPEPPPEGFDVEAILASIADTNGVD